MDERTELEKILDNYQVSHPMPEEFRKYVLESMEKNLEEILKRVGEDPFWNRLSTKIFFWKRSRAGE